MGKCCWKYLSWFCFILTAKEDWFDTSKMSQSAGIVQLTEDALDMIGKYIGDFITFRNFPHILLDTLFITGQKNIRWLIIILCFIKQNLLSSFEHVFLRCDIQSIRLGLHYNQSNFLKWCNFQWISRFQSGAFDCCWYLLLIDWLHFD